MVYKEQSNKPYSLKEAEQEVVDVRDVIYANPNMNDGDMYAMRLQYLMDEAKMVTSSCSGGQAKCPLESGDSICNRCAIFHIASPFKNEDGSRIVEGMCRGDSGSAVVTLQAEGTWIQTGVLEGGPIGSCGQYGMATKLSSYLGWIQKVLKKAKVPLPLEMRGRKFQDYLKKGEKL